MVKLHKVCKPIELSGSIKTFDIPGMANNFERLLAEKDIIADYKEKNSRRQKLAR